MRLSEASPSSAAVFRCAYAVPLLALLAAWERRRFGPRGRRERRLAFFAGILFAADLTFWHHSIGAVGAGLATVLGNVQVVLVGLIAWVALRERPDRRALISVPVVLFGVVLISGVVGSGAYGEDPALGVVMGLLTALAYAAFILVLRQGNRDLRRPAGPLLDATLTGAIFAALAGIAVGDVDFAPTWPTHGWLVLLPVSSQVLGWLLISVSLPRLPAVTTSIVLTLQPAGAVLLGVVLLRESPSTVQLLGVVVILAGVVAATAGPPARGRRAGVAPEGVAG